jgi:poly-D-alanine transfer protein DltD
MRKIIVCFSSLAISLLVLKFSVGVIDVSFFKEKSPVNNCLSFYRNLAVHPEFEHFYFSNETKYATIWVLGSSELTSPSPFRSFDFISARFQNKVIGVGESGNQSLSMLSQLMAHEDQLTNTPIVLLISPGWFCGKSQQGTDLQIFLSYNPTRSLSKILADEPNDPYKNYIKDYMLKQKQHLQNPDVNLRVALMKRKMDTNPIENIVYFPVISALKHIASMRHMSESEYNFSSFKANTNKNDISETQNTYINWDSLQQKSYQDFALNSTTNDLGVTNEFFKLHLNNTVTLSKIDPVSHDDDTEFADFKMLLSYLKLKKVNASIVLLPLNPIACVNLDELNPQVEKIKQEVSNVNFPLLNMWTTDKNTYVKGTLNDLMHLGECGWHTVNQFIIKTYKLQK